MSIFFCAENKNIFFRFQVLLFILVISYACSVKKDYTFLGKELCNGSNGPIRFLDLQTFQRYGSNKPYDISRIETRDSISITFYVIQDCCQKPIESIMISDMEIIVGYSFKGEKCDCVCDYLFKYDFDKDFVLNKELKVK